MKVVIAEPLTSSLGSLIHAKNKDWTIYDTPAADMAEFVERVKDAEIVASYFTKFDKKLIDQCPKLKYIVVGAVGVDSSVDMAEAKARGITVMNCPGYNSVAVAEAAISLAIDVSRNISRMYLTMLDGRWENDAYRTLSRSCISGKKIGLIGYGNIGKKIHELLGAWSNDFTIVNSTSTDTEIDQAIAESDIIFICCSLNDKTKNLINAERVSMLKKSAILINVSRGAVIDEDSLYEALANNKIAGAGLDVFVDEPTATGVLPENIKRFIELNNAVCLPHIAGSSNETGAVLAGMICDNIESALNGKPINMISQ